MMWQHLLDIYDESRLNPGQPACLFVETLVFNKGWLLRSALNEWKRPVTGRFSRTCPRSRSAPSRRYWKRMCFREIWPGPSGSGICGRSAMGIVQPIQPVPAVRAQVDVGVPNRAGVQSCRGGSRTALRTISASVLL